MVQQVCDSEREEIFDGEEVENAPVDPGLEEGVLVLGQAHVVQPTYHPLMIQTTRQVFARRRILFRLEGQQNLLSEKTRSDWNIL